MFDARRLLVLRELAARGTVTAVAGALNYSPSAVSRQLAVLEEEMGTALLEASGRRVRLTPAGEALVRRAGPILEQMERAESEVSVLASESQELSGRLRVAAFQTVLLDVIPMALERLAHLHPRLRVETGRLEPEDALPALSAHEYDLVLEEEYPSRPGPRRAGVTLRQVMTDEMVLAVPKSWTRVPLRELAEHPWVMEPAGSAARDWATQICREAGFEPEVRHVSDDMLVQLSLVRRGHAAAFVPETVVPHAPSGVAVEHLPGRPRRTVFSVVRAGGSTHPACTAFHEAFEHAVDRLHR
ncbi:LysR family transcriptional regulator [Nocardiopsis sp. HNM0947]|uniref:LysR family transcriptional regulator n=1 Tax=Nocardiopsis coralli TaxID=2772213 RepID=A0ABR9P8Z5_9ACTN|nr:LysR family transcriptional regulator [Nocardiopsis coralli]MBE3000306.1 LysR family transcriptional regulator [Nocardiopsis coralli]